MKKPDRYYLNAILKKWAERIEKWKDIPIRIADPIQQILICIIKSLDIDEKNCNSPTLKKIYKKDKDEFDQLCEQSNNLQNTKFKIKGKFFSVTRDLLLSQDFITTDKIVTTYYHLFYKYPIDEFGDNRVKIVDDLIKNVRTSNTHISMFLVELDKFL